jgi:uncharacterized protein YodC (DUF2158 family)
MTDVNDGAGLFSIGTLVYLKSGSPSLTVSDRRRTDGIVEVEWFAGDRLMRDAFHPTCLTTSVTEVRTRGVIDLLRKPLELHEGAPTMYERLAHGLAALLEQG